MPSRKRGSAFGGSLLRVPTPLPDDDLAAEDIPAEDPPAAPEAPEVSSAPSEPLVEPIGLESLPEGEESELEPNQARPTVSAPVEAPRRASRGSGGATPARTGRDRPPATIRLDDRAGAALWDAFVEEKKADPFLSYRQFASGVTLDGLGVRARRQKRS